MVVVRERPSAEREAEVGFERARWAGRDPRFPHLPFAVLIQTRRVSTKPIGQLLKDSARFATTVTPWVFVVLALWGKIDFSHPWGVVGRLVIAWVTAALVSVPFDIVIYALEERPKRKKGEQQADRGPET